MNNHTRSHCVLSEKGIIPIFQIIFFFFLFLVPVIFRAPSVGRDTEGYLRFYKFFLEGESLSWMLETHYFEPGYIVWNKIISIILPFSQGILIASGILAIWGYMRFIKKYAFSFFFSCIFFFLLRYYDLTFSMMRQAIALVMVLYSFDFIVRQRQIAFLMCLASAFCFHYSALFFLPAYYLQFFKFNKKNITLCIVLLIANLLTASFLSSFFLQYITTFEIFYRYADYENSDFINNGGKIAPYINIILHVFLLFFCCFSIKFRNLDATPDMSNYPTTIMLKFMVIGVLILGLSISFTQLERAAMYYNVFAIVAIPNCILQTKNKFLLLPIFLVLLSIYYVIIHLYRDGWVGIYPYHFCFQ